MLLSTRERAVYSGGSVSRSFGRTFRFLERLLQLSLLLRRDANCVSNFARLLKLVVYLNIAKRHFHVESSQLLSGHYSRSVASML